jgi:hypothetical protein
MNTSDKIALASATAAAGSWIWAIAQHHTARRANRNSERANVTAEQANARSDGANELARQANELSEQANRIAQDALAVAERGAVDAAKARLAARAPHIQVTQSSLDFRPLRIGIAANAPGMPLERDHVYRTPRDRNVLAGLRYSFTIKNLGPDATVNVTGQFAPDGPHATFTREPLTLTLETGQSETLEFEAYRPLSDWIRQHEEREAGGPGTVDLEAAVRWDDGHDEGVFGSVRVLVACNGLEPIPDEDGGWRFRHAMRNQHHESWPPTRVHVESTQLRYFESKRDDRELGAVPAPRAQEAAPVLRANSLTPGSGAGE